LGSILWGTGDYRVMVNTSLIYAVANAGLSVLLCYQWGVVGIAAATAITAVPVHVFFIVFAIRKFKVTLWDYAGRVWLGAMLGSLVGWLLSEIVAKFLTIQGLLRLLVLGFVFEVSFIVLTFLIGFSPQIRARLMRPILRLLATDYN